MNKIKIICTIGPASGSEEQIEKLMEAGMNIARLNFSHGTHEEHKVVITRIKKLRDQKGLNVGILQDLCGPKIRTGNLPETGILLEAEQQLHLTPGGEYKEVGGIVSVPVSYPPLLEDINPGKKILLDDGQLSLLVEAKTGTALICRVQNGGVLKSHKGVNFPGMALSQAVPTEKDFHDLAFGISEGVDFVALSFVQSRDQIEALKRRIAELGSRARVIAKLERGLAIQNLDELIAEADGLMVARGDLGIETELAMVPIYQKLIVRKCNLLGKPVITATQMLDSMIKNPIPTRAEATDVANAIYDGSDAIMLSGETAAGKYPVESVTIMRKIADNVENNLGLDRGWVRDSGAERDADIDLSIAHSIVKSAGEVQARAIIANTMTGQTARRIAMYRPQVPLIAITPSRETYFHLSLIWGVKALLNPVASDNFYSMIDNAEAVLKSKALVSPGDTVVISAGTPGEAPGGTNIMKLHKIRD